MYGGCSSQLRRASATGCLRLKQLDARADDRRFGEEKAALSSNHFRVGARHNHNDAVLGPELESGDSLDDLPRTLL